MSTLRKKIELGDGSKLVECQPELVEGGAIHAESIINNPPSASSG